MFLPTIWNYTKCIIGYVALLHHLAVSLRPNFSPVKTCTTLTLREIPVAVFDNCTGPGLVIHCLPDSKDDLGLSCYPPRWISPGKCPYYNTYQGNMDEKDCNQDHGNCPTGQFRSPLSVMYEGCYIKEEKIVTTTEAVTPTEVMKTTTCEPVKSNCSSFVSAAGEGKSTSCTGEIVACIVLVAIVLVLSGILVYKFRRVVTSMQCFQNSGSSSPDNGNPIEAVHLQQEEGM
ncbi:uncharacterized protein LOC128187919 [Crassostrea angulata]|uniref:uncharacterized protein LOC128187919 n=1 Tax=Magallana angulata TaxID=2784310 RepID=UPI0022B1E438|nr:uncharacterized protein LOC128187919 [Crassostrea angulata]XP_052714562.1 uncharacterized protein LOC128187919 [Crassostrea angulata]